MTASSNGDFTVFCPAELRENRCSPSTLDDDDIDMDDEDDGGDDDDDSPGLGYGLEAEPDPELEPLLPTAASFCFPFLLALWTLLSVALVTLRNTRSKSSLYPGHCLLALRHWLHVGFVSSHLILRVRHT